MRYRFSDFEFRPDSLELFQEGRKRKLQQQPAKLLKLLLAQPGQVVSREEILQALWGEDTFIEVDSSINFAVRQLRIALGDRASDPRFVETLPRLGYRFVGELEGSPPLPPQVSAPTSAASANAGSHRFPAWAVALFTLVVVSAAAVGWFSGRRSPETRAETPVVQVDPLFFTGTSPEGDELRRGLREQLVASLVRSYRGQVNVYASSESSTRRPPRDGYVLSGNVEQRSSSLVKVDLRLSGPDGRAVWADSYEGSVSGLRQWGGVLPSKIAGVFPREVGRAPLDLSLALPQEAALDDLTYGRYLRGVYRTQTLFGRRDADLFRRGVEDLENVVAAFPRFLDGQVALARAYLGGIAHFPTDQAFERAARLAEGVLEVEPQHPEALVARGEVALQARWDVASARRDFEEAQALNPGLARARHQMATIHAVAGETQAAVEAALDARRLDPANLFIQSDVGFFYMLSRQPAKAYEAALLAGETEPTHYLLHSVILWAAEAMGDEAEVLAEINRFLQAHGLDPVDDATGYFHRELRFLRAQEAAGNPMYFPLAENSIRIGNPQQAIDYLLRGCRNRNAPSLLFAETDPRLDPLRNHPAFDQLLDCVRETPTRAVSAST